MSCLTTDFCSVVLFAPLLENEFTISQRIFQLQIGRLEIFGIPIALERKKHKKKVFNIRAISDNFYFSSFGSWEILL